MKNIEVYYNATKTMIKKRIISIKVQPMRLSIKTILNQLRLSLALLLPFLFCQCSEKNNNGSADFRTIKRPEVKIINNELFYNPHKILACDGKIVVTGNDPKSGETCFVYDTDGALVWSGVLQGRGPAETLTGYMFPVSQNGIISYYDLQSKEKLTFKLSTLLTDGISAIEKTFADLPPWTLVYTGTSDGKEIILRSRMGNNEGTPSRTVDLRMDGILTDSFTELAFDNPEMTFITSIQAQVAISPSGKKMILCPTPGATLEIFSIDGLKLKRLALKKYIEPKIVVKGASYEREEDYVFGIEKVSATEDTIYAVYDGETTWADFKADKTKMIYRNIASFDWDGNPDILYKTDYRVRSVCELEDKLYMILEDESGLCMIARMNK